MRVLLAAVMLKAMIGFVNADCWVNIAACRLTDNNGKCIQYFAPGSEANAIYSTDELYALRPSGLYTVQSCLQSPAPADALYLGLIGLNITGFPSTLFKSAVKVRDIDLSKNQLDGLHVPCDAFSANTLLRSINMNYNNQKRIDCNLFSANTQLDEIRLGHNQYTSITPTLFKGLTKLGYIYLNDNKLSSLSATQFQGLSRLTVLDLSNNAFTYLPENIFADNSIDSGFPSSMYAKGNPWKVCSSGRNDKSMEGSALCSSPQALV